MRLLPAPPADPNVLVGLAASDDAGVYKLTDNLALVQSIDFFTPIVDDPYDYGRIAAANALSDLYAMGARPVTALNVVAFPIGTLGATVLVAILRGGAEMVAAAGAVLIGGHSIDDAEPKYGLVVTGLVDPQDLWTNGGARPGDALILTKPIGVGAITTGIKRGVVAADVADQAVRCMAQLNDGAARAGARVGVHSCTDVSGFGLLGHVAEMARASGVGIEIFSGAVPVLPGAAALVAADVCPGGTRTNLRDVAGSVNFAAGIAAAEQLLLADAVTSGGLLFALPQAKAAALQRELERESTLAAAVIGRVTAGPPGQIAVTA